MRFTWLIALYLLMVSVVAAAADKLPKPGDSTWYGGGPYRVAAADFTGDGILDLALVYNRIGLLTIQKGDGQGGFTHLAHVEFDVPKPSEIAGVYNLDVGDVDNDGRLDIACTPLGVPPNQWKDQDIPDDQWSQAHRGNAVVVRNLGDGRFETIGEYPTPSLAVGVNLSDLDRDGHLDLLYTARGSGYKGDLKLGILFLRKGIGDGAFAEATEYEAGPSAYYVETADFDEDGYLDIAVPNEHGDTVQVWISPGETVFQREALQRRTLKTTRIPGRRSHAVNDVRAGDFNGDGHIDLVTANLGTSTSSIFLGNGDGTFQKDSILEAGQNGAFLAIGDLNEDGQHDYVITHWTEEFLSTFLNLGDAKFADRIDSRTGSGNYGVTLADLNADGHLDAVTANYRERSISVLLGQGDGTFQDARTVNKGYHRFQGRWYPEK